MFSVKIDSKAVQDMIKALPKEAGRAAEIALDKTAFDIKAAEVAKMKQVFDSPTRFTLNSLKVTRTRNHNMQASVWFKEPDRMGQHYLVPQVEGGPRKYKGFERGFGDTMFIPGQFARRTKAGNMSPAQIRQIMSVLGKAERTAGYSANLTARSAKRNRKDRDYVYIRRRHGRLLPGIYERFQTGVGFGYKTKRSLPFGVYQKGRRRGRFASVVRARGLKPIMLVGRQRKPYKPRLPFYEVAQDTFDERFYIHFYRELDKQLGR